MSLLIDELAAQVRGFVDSARDRYPSGHTASYIPALQNVDASLLGISLAAMDGTTIHVGDWDAPFTLQSVSKVFNFIAVAELRGLHDVMELVDLEPTGDPFNSIVRLELQNPGRPFNPMINAGAIAVASMLPGWNVEEKFEAYMGVIERFFGKRPKVNMDVYESEMSSVFKNMAIAYYLKELGYLECDVDTAVSVYTLQCAVEATTDSLATAALRLAKAEAGYVSKDVARVTKSLMLTCGMYNASGKQAAFVGIPAKSGVSGGILASVPVGNQSGPNPFVNGCGIGVFGPSIDEMGNSVTGVTLLQRLSREWSLSIF